jgi:hypothetical protein
MLTIKNVFEAEKSISYFPEWSQPESETGYVWFDAPIEIRGVTETRLVLHGGCFSRLPERNVSFKLRYLKAPGKRCLPIERVDWKSQGGHSNPRKPRSDWSGQRVSETHLHEFILNWSESKKRMRFGTLPTAREISTKLNDFKSLREYAGNRFRINNIDVVSNPPWVYDFFTQGMMK